MKTTDFLKENEFIAQDAHSMHQDHQHQMLREECYHIAVNAVALHKLLGAMDQGAPLEPWAAEYISLANDHLKSVKESLEYGALEGVEELPSFDAEAAEQMFESKVSIKENATGGATGAGSVAVVSGALGEKGGFSKKDVDKKLGSYTNMLTRGGVVKAGKK
jgi:hypothetical protein